MNVCNIINLFQLDFLFFGIFCSVLPSSVLGVQLCFMFLKLRYFLYLILCRRYKMTTGLPTSQVYFLCSSAKVKQFLQLSLNFPGGGYSLGNLLCMCDL